MTTILLAAVGSAIGGSVLAGLGTIGTVAIGAAIGEAAGAVLGSVIDHAAFNALFPPPGQKGPRLKITDIQSSTEGTAIPKVYGRLRIPGQIIWATRFEEKSKDTGDSKSGGVVTTYSYFGNFAVGICEGTVGANLDGVSSLDPNSDVNGIGRIWADGVEVDRSDVNIRVYPGDELQVIDPLIEAKEGDDNAPAYRGVAYAVIEHLRLEHWGNRLPQFTFEIFRPVGAIEGKLTGPGVTVEAGIEGIAIVGAGEFGLDTVVQKKVTSDGKTKENRHTLAAASDFQASLDAFDRVSAYHGTVALMVPWFGNDLRAGNCTVKPKVDSAVKDTKPGLWSVSQQARASAGVITDQSLRGTPSDASVVAALQEIWSRGERAVLCPIIEMDIAAGNALPNPYSNSAGTNGQPAYPWRGRITCSPAAGFTGSVDKTSTAATQVTAFMGAAAAGNFLSTPAGPVYLGSPTDWGYRRFILHYAALIRGARDGATSRSQAALFIGGGLTGLERVRSDGTTYPFVAALKTLAADCRTLLGVETEIVANDTPPPSTVDIGIKIGYSADWTSWNNHRPDDGSGDVLFNLDPLWSDANIAMVGIDAFFPLSDWRDGSDHLDFDPHGPISSYDREYLASNVRGGEYFDWTYADDAARAAQIRTPITDSFSPDEPWVFRQKDIRGWFLSSHFNRLGGVPSGVATAWVPKGKTIVFNTYGCPAIDKGANLPHAGMRGRETAPYASSGARDDGMQRAWLEALLAHYRNDGLGDTTFNNPFSLITGNFMVDLGFSHAYAWDARPWPSFPQDATWPDAAAYDTGHWLSGRLGTAPMRETIIRILADNDFADYEIEDIGTVVDGVSNDSVTSARAALESIQSAFRFDAIESGDKIKFLQRDGRPAVATLTLDDLVVDDGDPADRFKLTRAQEIDLPDMVQISYGDPARDDQPASVDAHRSTATSTRVTSLSPPVVMDEAKARAIAEIELYAAWVGRERGTFSLPPSIAVAMDPGDVVLTNFGPVPRRMKASQVTYGAAVALEVFEVPAAEFAPPALARSGGKVSSPPATLDTLVVLIDGPLLADEDNDYAGYIAGIKSPFGAGIAAYRSPATSGYTLDTLLAAATTIGETTSDFASGPAWRWDRKNALNVSLLRGTVASADELLVLNGANAVFLENQDGEWELLQFRTATPTGSRAYALTNLLRGQKGSEHAMRDPVPAGARVVVLDAGIRQTGLPSALVGLLLNWRAGPADEDIGSEDYVDFTATMTAKARRPYSPDHLSGMRDAITGDWALSWIRRTRIGGDYWDPVDVPLGESVESYRLEILSEAVSGVDVARTVDLSAPSFTYTEAMQVADFGMQQSELAIRVTQISSTYGLGIPATAIITETRRAA